MLLLNVCPQDRVEVTCCSVWDQNRKWTLVGVSVEAGMTIDGWFSSRVPAA